MNFLKREEEEINFQMTQRGTEEWCLQYLQHFYRDEKIAPQPARFLGESRGFTRLEDIARSSDRSSRVMVDVLGVRLEIIVEILFE